MIRLFHGSNQIVEQIDLSKGRKNKDFGSGFYTTDLKRQAEQWAQRIVERYGGEPYVSEFVFDLEGAISCGLKVKVFKNADKEWALFVMQNRNHKGTNNSHDYDIVIGPVANDRMARLFSLYDQEIIDLNAVVAGLVYKDLNSQYFFATERSLNYIKRL